MATETVSMLSYTIQTGRVRPPLLSVSLRVSVFDARVLVRETELGRKKI